VTAPLVIIDTNVIVSGLLTADDGAPTAAILDHALSGEIRTVLSVDLLAEYRSVLLRPGIRSRHGLDESQIDAILTAIAENAVICDPVEPPSAPPDPGDLHLWSMLAARPDAVLVTGDQALVDDSPDWAAVVTARAFVESR